MHWRSTARAGGGVRSLQAVLRSCRAAPWSPPAAHVPASPRPPTPQTHLEDLALHVKQLAGKGERGAPLARPRLGGQLAHALLLVVVGLHAHDRRRAARRGCRRAVAGARGPAAHELRHAGRGTCRAAAGCPGGLQSVSILRPGRASAPAAPRCLACGSPPGSRPRTCGGGAPGGSGPHQAPHRHGARAGRMRCTKARGLAQPSPLGMHHRPHL